MRTGTSARGRADGGTPAWAEGRDVAPVIEGIEDDLDTMRDIIAEMDTAPEHALPLMSDKGDYRDDLNRQLDRVLGLVLGDLYDESRAALFALDEEREGLDARIAELRIDRITAPRSADVVGVVDRTLNRFAQGSIEAIEAEIAQLEAQGRSWSGGGCAAAGLRGPADGGVRRGDLA